MNRRALFSVSDKTDIDKFARGLKEIGFDIFATGGTARYLIENGVEVFELSKITGFDKLIGGRVKTLHPYIFASILSRDNSEDKKELEDLGLIPFEVICVNLYAFKEKALGGMLDVEDAMDEVDIGGVALIRAGAKAHHRCYVATSPDDYSLVLESLRSQADGYPLRRQLAKKAFALTSQYDAMIAYYFSKLELPKALPDIFYLAYTKKQELRYGENPHQRAGLYLPILGISGSIANGRQLSGKEISLNNILDMESAYHLVMEFDKPASAVIKHMNPCGCAVSDDIITAIERARAGDPVSAFGGIVAVNRPIDEDVAGEIVGPKGFLEVVIAPEILPTAVEILRQRKGWGEKLIVYVASEISNDEFETRWIRGGLLVMDQDKTQDLRKRVQVVTKRGPTSKEMEDMIFAFTLVKYVKSNGIVIVRDKMMIGLGAGQPNRVNSVKLAIECAEKFHGGCDGAVLASDGFFPMSDAPLLAVEAGVSAIIQPGGSVKDEEVIRDIDRFGASMVFTGIRHFKH
ncbi:MAG: bifunctional phosphoribosylaminoimidazolecarboxamide formyltransferase/IMP cyclohydrolase [bacterium]